MTWNSIFPDGTKTLKANTEIGNQNNLYIHQKMGEDVIGINKESTRDHFWAVDANELPILDGHHRFVKMPAFTSTVVSPNDIDPAFSSPIDQVLYAKLKLIADSTVQQDVQPFCENSSAIMQVLGIRACCLFQAIVIGSIDKLDKLKVEIKFLYNHNISAITPDDVGLGTYTVKYNNNLPSNNYLFLGGGFSFDKNKQISINLQGSTAINTVKGLNGLKLLVKIEATLPLIRSFQGWFVCFGG